MNCSKPSPLWTRRRCSRGWPQLVDAELLYQRGLPPRSHVCLQACPHPGGGLSVVAAGAPGSSTTSGLPRCWRRSFPRRSRPSRNCWRIITRKPASASRLSATGSGRASVPTSARQTLRPSVTSPRDWKCSRRSRRPRTSPARTRHCKLVLAQALKDAKGYGHPAVEQAYTRARELCRQIGETPQLFPALLGLSIYYVVRAELQTARELGAQLLSLAQRAQDPVLLVEAHYSLGVTCFWLGEFAPAREHLEQGIVHYDAPAAPCSSRALWPGRRGGVLVSCGHLSSGISVIRTRRCARSHEALVLGPGVVASL